MIIEVHLILPEVYGSTFVGIKRREEVLCETIPALAPENENHQNFVSKHCWTSYVFRRTVTLGRSLPGGHRLGWISSQRALHLGSLSRSWRTTPVNICIQVLLPKTKWRLDTSYHFMLWSEFYHFMLWSEFSYLQRGFRHTSLLLEKEKVLIRQPALLGSHCEIWNFLLHWKWHHNFLFTRC